jgi:hypothetical protein
MSKHTPGPWSVKNDYDERHIVIANIDGESFPDGTTSYTYDFVCDTYGGDYESASRVVANANARLIAAAPELLEALRKADQFMTNGIELGYIKLPTIPDPALATPGIVRAAIAKAEGR